MEALHLIQQLIKFPKLFGHEYTYSKIRGKCVASFVFFLIITALSACNSQEKNNELTIHTGNGSHKISIEIADEPNEQTRGLMFRREMDQNHGMLFIYKDDQIRTMWMKNTYLSLDMLFIKADGTVKHLHKNAEPFSEEIISSREPVRAVLELVAGTIDRLNIQNGDRVTHRFFKQE